MRFFERLSILVERVLDAVSRFLDPALPWVFLALRRALLATVAAVIVAVLLFVVPQSQEVLRGLGEAPLGAIQDFDGKLPHAINLWAYVCHVATAVGLGFGTWYAGRLLSTVEAKSATPVALAEGARAARLARATTWLPRALGVFVLAAAIAALLYASVTPRLPQWAALALAALAVGGPLLVAAGRLASWSGVRWLGVAATLAAAALLLRFVNGWSVGVAGILSSMLPGVFLWFIVERRRILERMHWGRHEQPHETRSFGEVIVTLFLVILGSAALLVSLGALPAGWVRAFGSAAAVQLFVAAAVLFGTGLHIVLRRAARNVPGLTVAALIVFAGAVALFGKESLGDEKLAPPKDVAAAVPVGAPAPTASAAPAPRALYVNAYGGGLRAAVFTAHVLARADDESCGRFGEQVAAFSGVSGGSVGIATYLVARQEYKRMTDGGWPGCIAGEHRGEKPLTTIVVRALVQDHLSPTIARMLAVDAPHLPWWSPSRGQALLDSWQSALVVALERARAAHQVGSDVPPAAFAQPLGALTGGMAHPAPVYFNATDADSGQITWFSNRDGGQVRDPVSGKAVAETRLSVGQAVLHSARFPIVSPAGRYRTAEEERRAAAGAQVPPHRLVDGGYADNSGTLTLAAVRRLAPRDAPTPWLIDIDGNPPAASTCRPDDVSHPPILTALRALLQARSAHAERAANDFKGEVGDAFIDARLDCGPAHADQAPLGWYMSVDAARSLQRSADASVRQICARLADLCLPPSKKP